jgi:hypothetical protein
MKLPACLAPDYSDARQRFIDVDGASFNGGTDATADIRRSFRTPASKAATLVGVLFAAAATLLARRYGFDKPCGPLFLMLSAAYPYIHTELYRKQRPIREKEFLTLKRALIDKSGRATPSPGATLEVDEYYRCEITSSARFIAVVPTMVAAAGCIVHVMLNVPPGLMAGITSLLTSLGLVPHAARLAWALYARHQLHRQERPWTVTTDPPRVESRVSRPAGDRLALASVAVRGRAL